MELGRVRKDKWITNPFESDEAGKAKTTEKGIVITEARTFVAPNNTLIKLHANSEILYFCDYEDWLKNTGFLYKFKTGNKTWESKGSYSGNGYLFDGYYSGNEKYPESNQYVKAGSEVWTVSQLITYDESNKNINKRELSTREVRVKSMSYTCFHDEAETLNNGEKVTAITNCGGTGNATSPMDWNSIKSGLDNLNKKLNDAWNINVIDKDGKTHSLATGSKGTVTYKYDKTNKKWVAEIAGISDNEVKQIITDAINKKLEAFQIDENGKSKIEKTTTTPIQTEDGGEFRFGDSLHWYEWGGVLADAGTAIYENATLPETYWKQDHPKYKDYPLHASPTFTGIADGVIDEITGTAQLVKLGLEIATDKEKATKLWKSAKNITFSGIKTAATGAIKEKWDRYANSPNYITYHELGKDGVQVASMIYGGFAAKGKKLSEAVEESGEIIKKKIKDKIDEIDEFFKGGIKNVDGKTIDDLLNEARQRYKGNLDFDEWAAKYKTLYKNREVGKITESKFDELFGSDALHLEIQTGNGKRYIDNVKDGVGKEIKSGKVSLSAYKDQILKDLDIIESELDIRVNKIEWHCFSGIDNNVEPFIKEELVKRNLNPDKFKIIVY